MGSFRTTKARNADVAEVNHENRPALLAEGEWVKYRTVLPHSVAVRIADEAAMPVMERVKGKDVISGVKLRSGTVGAIKLETGIVAWNLLDEDGHPAPAWDAQKADQLVAGLSDELRSELSKLIDSRRPPELDDKDAETGETEGNESGES